MFAGAIFAGERVHGLRLLGAGLAFLGLVWLVWPGDGSGEAATVGVLATLFMVLAGIGWGIYSLVGRRAQDALLSTAANFILAVPLAFVGASVLVPGMWEAATGRGILLALVSGGVTSGLGYALWYAVLPKLAGSVAAVAQLTVPMIAMAGGMVFLGEALTGRFALASVVILGGVALSVLGPRYFARSSRGS
jgi:drug/metabolite transporter (DMT)-like permease